MASLARRPRVAPPTRPCGAPRTGGRYSGEPAFWAVWTWAACTWATCTWSVGAAEVEKIGPRESAITLVRTRRTFRPGARDGSCIGGFLLSRSGHGGDRGVRRRIGDEEDADLLRLALER